MLVFSTDFMYHIMIESIIKELVSDWVLLNGSLIHLAS